MKHLFLLIIVLLGLVATSVHAAPTVEGTGGGGEPTPTPSAEQAITTEVQASGEAHLYPTANAPQVGRVEPGDTVRVVEQLDDWYRIEVVERALGGPVIPLADGWVGEDVFGEPLDGVPPASRPTAVPTATATATPNSGPSAAPSAAPTAVPFGVEPTPTVTPPLVPTPPIVAGSDVGTIPGSAGGSGGGTDTTIPGSAGGSASAPISTRQPVLVSRPIIIYQCLDTNADRACNVNEGIAGVTAYALNARTGEVLGQSVSNERGITQIYVNVLSDQELVIDVPFLDHNEAVRPTDTDAITILNDDVAAIPGLLP